MQKIISVFQRNYETDRRIRNEVVPGAEWVIAGEGIATRKWDGCGCMIEDGALFKRYELKKGRTAPSRFIPAQEPDGTTGDQPGWIRVGAGSEDRWFRTALDNFTNNSVVLLKNGTYEAVGPHFQGNPEDLPEDTLVIHGEDELYNCPRDFDGIRLFLQALDIEGIVFIHRQLGRMAKVKKKDYGLRRVPEENRKYA